MRGGLDFDNTIVGYDMLFHQVAREVGLIPQDLPPYKLLVREHLRRIGKEDLWTEMQGLVYGARMAEAKAFAGVREFLRWARAEGIELFIVSHKTQYPFLGPKYDLHAAAKRWIKQYLCDEDGPLIESENSFFELTKEEKCARIAALECDWFLDDLPELLTSPAFPKHIVPLLFDPESNHVGTGLQTVKSWAALRDLIVSRWQHSR